MFPSSERDPTSTARDLLRLCLPLIVAGGLLAICVALVAAQGPVDLTRVTTASDPASRDSRAPSISADGLWVAFHSDSDFLSQGIAINQYEIWLYDTSAMTLTRATTASHTNRASRNASLSADGRWVAFYSDSHFLGQYIDNNQYEIWLYDQTTMTITRVTTGSAANRDSTNAEMNGDGRWVAFESDSDLLGQGIANDQYEIWLYDAQAVTYTRAPTPPVATATSPASAAMGAGWPSRAIPTSWARATSPTTNMRYGSTTPRR